MKSWIADHYNLEVLNSAQLRAAIKTAWEAVPEDLLLRLAHSIPRRLQLVIENGGGGIEY
jgi:hypothetical protein